MTDGENVHVLATRTQGGKSTGIIVYENIHHLSNMNTPYKFVADLSQMASY